MGRTVAIVGNVHQRSLEMVLADHPKARVPNQFGEIAPAGGEAAELFGTVNVLDGRSTLETRLASLGWRGLWLGHLLWGLLVGLIVRLVQSTTIPLNGGKRSLAGCRRARSPAVGHGVAVGSLWELLVAVIIYLLNSAFVVVEAHATSHKRGRGGMCSGYHCCCSGYHWCFVDCVVGA